MSETRALFFIKPGAGKRLSGDIEAEIRDISRRYDYEYIIYKLEEKPDLPGIERLFDDFGPTVAVAAGGDGTVNLVSRIIAEKDIRLGIIPLGSSNGMAYQLNIPDSLEDAIDIIARGKSKKADRVIINHSHLCLHMSDLGMNARIIKRREKEDMKGFLGYARQYLKELGRRKKFSCTIITGEKKITAKTVMVVIANGSYYGTGAVINPDGQLDDETFEIVLIKAYTFKFLLHMLITIIFRNYKAESLKTIIKAHKASIFVRPPQDLQIDGEMLGKKGKVEAKIASRKLDIIYSNKRV